MLISAVFVDLDDTLFPQAVWLSGAFDAVVRAAPPSVPSAEFRRALAAVAREGSDRGRIIDRALARTGRSSIPVGPLVEAFRSYRPTALAPYPGVKAVLRKLRHEVPVAVVTDGHPGVQLGKLDALGLADAFDAAVISDRFGRQFRKPHPRPFLAAAEELGVAPDRCLHIGDHPDKDVQGAVGAGLFGAIRVRTGEYAHRPDTKPYIASAPDLCQAIDWLLDRSQIGRLKAYSS